MNDQNLDGVKVDGDVANPGARLAEIAGELNLLGLAHPPQAHVRSRLRQRTLRHKQRRKNVKPIRFIAAPKSLLETSLRIYTNAARRATEWLSLVGLRGGGAGIPIGTRRRRVSLAAGSSNRSKEPDT